jgi:hypothetical protein
MGFDPHRRYVPKRADYVFVALALITTAALVVWGLFG